MIRETEGVALHRAERFALTLAVRYRPHGARRWAEGLSVNISRTGLLFSTSQTPLSRGDEIDFLIHLPPIQGAPGGQARCSGHVARVVLPSGEAAIALMAVTIERYALAPESDVLRERESESRRRGPPGQGG